MEKTFGLNEVFSARPKSIFPSMTALANAHDAINLGQGFPDEDGPSELLALAAKSLCDGPNQYVPIEGVGELRAAVAAASKTHFDLDIDPDKETLVVAGATEGLAAAFLAFCTPGDEVVLFEPFYECYAPQAEAAGARPAYVRLHAPEFRITAEALNQAISPRTKLIVLNSPHNPSGRVFDTEELRIVADAACAHNLIVICDDVYEHMVFDGQHHHPLALLPGMKDRCLRLGSAGKTFSVTGWRIGYATGPEELITALSRAHQFIAYTSPGHLQHAVAAGLRLPNAYFQGLAQAMQDRRDLLQAGLKELGFRVLPCEGAYFITIDIRDAGRENDTDFCHEITAKAGVAAVPFSAFYRPGAKDAPRHYARFCFAKRPEVLTAALGRLRDYFQ